MVGTSRPLVFCNKICVFVTLSDFSENLAKVWHGQKNSNLIERGERPTLSHRFELSYTSLGPKLTTEIGFYPARVRARKISSNFYPTDMQMMPFHLKSSNIYWSFSNFSNFPHLFTVFPCFSSRKPNDNFFFFSFSLVFLFVCLFVKLSMYWKSLVHLLISSKFSNFTLITL